MASWKVALILLLAPSTVRAQGGSPRLELSMPVSIVAGVDAPTVSMSDILSEGHRREMLLSGWPTALHCRVELWKRGLIFAGREAVVEWDIIVEYLPATRQYQVRRVQDGRLEELGSVSSVDDAETIIGRPYRVPISPRVSGGRYFYIFEMDLTTLSMSDIDAWRKWLRWDPLESTCRHASLSIL